MMSGVSLDELRCRPADSFFALKVESEGRGCTSTHQLSNSDAQDVVSTSQHQQQQQRDKVWKETVEVILQWVAGAIHGDTQSVHLIDLLLEELSDAMPFTGSCVSPRGCCSCCLTSPVGMEWAPAEGCDVDKRKSCGAYGAGRIDRELYPRDVAPESSSSSGSLLGAMVEAEMARRNALGEGAEIMRGEETEFSDRDVQWQWHGGPERLPGEGRWGYPAFFPDEWSDTAGKGTDSDSDGEGCGWNSSGSGSLVQDGGFDAPLESVVSLEGSECVDDALSTGTRFKVLDSDEGGDVERRWHHSFGEYASHRYVRMASNDRWPFV